MPDLRKSIITEEIGFWTHLYNNSDFETVRRKDYIDKIGFFTPEILQQEGVGIDLGCGLMSVWEFYAGVKKKVLAIDPLMNEYNKLYKNRIPSCARDGENLPLADSCLDWIFCVNMLDHTPDPDKLVSEVKRVLKPSGTLYLEVHFDDYLGSAHYKLWNDSVVKEHLVPLSLVRCYKRRIDETYQTLYIGIYKNG